MYGFHYNHIKKKYGDRAQLLFTDTDSLCYDIQTKDFHDDIRNDVPTMYEAGGRQIKEFVGLRSKLYAFKIHGYDTMCDNVQYTGSCGKPSWVGRGGKKCKGIKKSVVKGKWQQNFLLSHLKDTPKQYIEVYYRIFISALFGEIF